MCRFLACLPILMSLSFSVLAETPATSGPANPELAKRLGADNYGMRQYVLVVLKTGPNTMPEGEQRKAMFAGHFANMTRLSEEGKLALAGPFGKNDEGWRGLFIMATADIEEARSWTATDPVIVNGEMIAEFTPWYGSAALMQVGEIHKQIAASSP